MRGASYISYIHMYIYIYVHMYIRIYFCLNDFLDPTTVRSNTISRLCNTDTICIEELATLTEPACYHAWTVGPMIETLPSELERRVRAAAAATGHNQLLTSPKCTLISET